LCLTFWKQKKTKRWWWRKNNGFLIFFCAVYKNKQTTLFSCVWMCVIFFSSLILKRWSFFKWFFFFFSLFCVCTLKLYYTNKWNKNLTKVWITYFNSMSTKNQKYILMGYQQSIKGIILDYFRWHHLLIYIRRYYLHVDFNNMNWTLSFY
jgi:hypothetical protein